MTIIAPKQGPKRRHSLRFVLGQLASGITAWGSSRLWWPLFMWLYNGGSITHIVLLIDINYTPCFTGGFIMCAYMLAFYWSITNQSKLAPTHRIDNHMVLWAYNILAIGSCIGSVAFGELILQGNIKDTLLIQSSALGAGVFTMLGTVCYFFPRKFCPTEATQNDAVTTLTV